MIIFREMFLHLFLNLNRLIVGEINEVFRFGLRVISQNQTQVKEKKNIPNESLKNKKKLKQKL